MNINRIKKNIKKVEEIVENIDVQDVINRIEANEENSIKISNDMNYGTIELRKLGNSNLGGTDIKIEVSTKFNWLQKKLWKYLLNIEIEDIKEDE